MTGAVYARTPNLGLGLIEYDFPNWADDANQNTKIIDSAQALVGISVKGAWENNVPYVRGDLVVDTDQNTIWRAQINHTSAASGSFEDDRTANPTYWADASQALHARGMWTPATTYYINDVVYEDANQYSWALATRQFTSGGSYDADVAAGNLVIITDTTNAVTDAENSKVDAQTAASQAAVSADGASASATSAATSASDAANSASAASSSASAAAGSQTAAAGSATAAASSASAASASATSASTSATNAAASAASAAASLAAMLPDAPSDGKTYGRFNGTWQPFSAAATTQDTPPSTPQNGQLWYETDSGNTYIYYNDGSSSQWVQVNTIGNGAGGLLTGTGVPAGSTGSDGNYYIDTATGIMYGPKSGTTWPVTIHMVNAAGDTMTGNLTITKSNPSYVLNKTATAQNDAIYAYNNGSLRALFLLANGSDNMQLQCYDDAGAYLFDYFTGTRLTGLVTVKGDPTAALGIATKQYVDAAAAVPPMGNVYLSLSGGNISMAKQDGNKLWINGVNELVPASAVTLSPSGTAASTLYYIYAFMSSGTMTLEYSTTVPVSHTNWGVRVKTGDNTRTLVGMAMSAAAGAWSTSAVQLLSWFNKRQKSAVSTTASPTATGAAAELSTTLRVPFLSWAGFETNVGFYANNISHSGTAQDIISDLRVDTVTIMPSPIKGRVSAITSSQSYPLSILHPATGLSEGSHTASPYGSSSSATATWTTAWSSVSVMG